MICVLGTNLRLEKTNVDVGINGRIIIVSTVRVRKIVNVVGFEIN